MEPDWTGILLPLCFGVVFAGIGIALLVFGINQRRKARATEQWPTAAGTITAARIDQERRTTRTQGRTETHVTYKPVVEYTYDANGTRFQGGRLSPGGDMSYDYNTAQRFLSKYQPGQPATVHYDPANPAQAVLETQAAGSMVLFVVGGIFLLIGILAGGVTTVIELLKLL